MLRYMFGCSGVGLSFLSSVVTSSTSNAEVVPCLCMMLRRFDNNCLACFSRRKRRDAAGCEFIELFITILLLDAHIKRVASTI